MSSTVATPAFTTEFATAYREMMLGSMQHYEMGVTKRVLAAVPENKKNFKPAENSRTAWELAVHLAQSDVWFLEGIAQRSFEMTGDPGVPANTVPELIAWYEKNFHAAAAKVRAMSAEQLLTPVDFFGIMKAPVFLFLDFAVKHAVHHRGQLSAYLRPMGVKVPDIYGGSFDEPFQG